MRIVLCVVLAACSSPSAGPGALPPLTTGGSPPAQRYVRIELGTARGHATRTTFELASSGDRVSLLETYEQDRRSLTIADADSDPRWQISGTHRYRGVRRATCDGCAVFHVDLEAADAQPLHLWCEPRTLAVSSAGARPVHRRGAPCAPSVWEPPGKSHAVVLVCGAAARDTSDADPDDQLVFAPDRGLEWIDEKDDGCSAGGLRLAR